MSKICLNKWKLRPASGSAVIVPDDISFPDFIEADVPGDVFLDLAGADLIVDPFYADNELKLGWIPQCDWEYFAAFKVEKISDFDFLQFEGLDTFAEVFLNDILIGHTENMFIRHTFDIKKHLKTGENNLHVILRSPLKKAAENKTAIRQLPSARHKDRVYIRKAQYSFGWDWGPAFPASGIWKEVYLKKSQPEIDHIAFETISIENKRARIRLKVVLKNNHSEELFMTVRLYDKSQAYEKTLPVSATNEINTRFEIENPRLWWPHDQGIPYLYNLEISLMNLSEQEINRYEKKVGIRTVELKLKEKDQNCYRFYINGKPVYLKGANWIPADSFLPRVSKEKYKSLIQSAHNANINIMRVWGGGIYEDEYFYEQCDQAGILIWQDFMFACATYPDHEKFLSNVKEEITQNVNRLKYHPSILIWCGNNENEWIWYRDNCGPVTSMQGFDFFHKIIPDWLNTLDTTRPYWPSSPFGDEEDPNAPLSGNRHVWDIWSNWVDYENVKNDQSLFVTEFGFQAPATLQTFKSVIPAAVKSSQDALFEFHNKQDEGSERLFRFLSAHLPVRTDLESFIYLTQLNQGLALKTCLEHWRSRWPATSGSIIWQINDCWPVSSWSLIDYHNRRKHSYYFTKHSFQNMLISITGHKEQLNISVINDNPFEKEIELVLYLWNFKTDEGREIKKTKVALAASQKSEAYHLQKEMLTNKCLIATAYSDEGKLESRNFFTFEKWKHINLPEAKYDLKMVSDDTLVVKSNSILFFLRIEHPDLEMQDLPEVMLPGEEHMISMIPARLNQQKLSELSVTALNNFLCKI